MFQERNCPDRRWTKSGGSWLAPAAEPTGIRPPPHLLLRRPTDGTQGPFLPRVSCCSSAQSRRQMAGSGWPFAAIALAVTVLTALAIPAEAAGDKSKRVSHRDAECLSAWWENRAAFEKNRFHVRTMCSAYGRVVASVESGTPGTEH